MLKSQLLLTQLPLEDTIWLKRKTFSSNGINQYKVQLREFFSHKLDSLPITPLSMPRSPQMLLSSRLKKMRAHQELQSKESMFLLLSHIKTPTMDHHGSPIHKEKELLSTLKLRSQRKLTLLTQRLLELTPPSTTSKTSCGETNKLSVKRKLTQLVQLITTHGCMRPLRTVWELKCNTLNNQLTQRDMIIKFMSSLET